ncbi:MAG: dehydrogenase [Bacteroidetes bacterium GWF2_42_66]|nr:MAG: dehydrogenase [Bacteroidetes bacterium GWA2_42_15]OFY02822.1 MAG: dehydrogenase [Bacteroidetes bacterium GWE2_42_39]OFY44476.1 MAG: dehydrogenase [Bacteroidetes bacterium GWF2_42_66]HBL74979.1 dehydrogenase [Prolixibacteraceae bacterium]HCR90082.1 dehydrogenase [Prolixibacteraceae bacterium]
MKTTILQICFILFAGTLFSQESEDIRLNPPDKTRGLAVMEALSVRASVSSFDTTEIRLQDLSDLLWAANGVNRPESGKRTAPSAHNAQDIDVYVFMKQGVYLYVAKEHVLSFIEEGDYRTLIAGRQAYVASAPVICLLVSDISRFPSGEKDQRLKSAAIDAGIVSQNIALFCASSGLVTRPRATMDQQKLREILKLNDNQHLILNNPVSYK